MLEAPSTSALTAAVLALTEELVSAPSVTPDDAGCQNKMVGILEPLGFECEFINSGPVSNLWASRTYGPGPHLVFAGHTDVVPTGPLEDWQSNPFEPTVRDGYLYGRGTADMKASLAAMLIAVQHLHLQAGKLSFLITSDEEGIAIDGTRHVVQVLAQRGINPDYCIVGEPSSSDKLGDVVRNGRRGSLNCELKIIGVQGHVAYPEEASNPIHLALEALTALTTRVWDKGNEYFPPTSFQISNINAGTGATNVIPGKLTVLCNFRYNTDHTADQLKAQFEGLLNEYNLDFEANWQHSGTPFLTARGALTDAVSEAVTEVLDYPPQLSTGGGTSDGRFIAPWHGQHQVDVIELGPVNATIHKVDECTKIADLGNLARVYLTILTRLLN